MAKASSNEKVVFLVYWMSYDLNGNLLDGFDRDDRCLIGVYSNRSNTEDAVERPKLCEGFSDYPNYFLIDKYALDQDNWTTGFSRE